MEEEEVEYAIYTLGSTDDINHKEDVKVFHEVHGWKDLTIQELDFEYIPAKTNTWWCDSDSNTSNKNNNNILSIPKYRQSKITEYFWPKQGFLGDLNITEFDFTEINEIQNQVDANEEKLREEQMQDIKSFEKEKLDEYFEYMTEIENYMEKRCATCQHSPCWWDQNRSDIEQWCIDHIGHDEVWEDMLAKWCRRQVTREVNRRLHGPDANLLQTLPICWKIGVFRLYLPYHLKIHFWDPIHWGKP